MKFVFGTIDNFGDRHILVGNALPSLSDMASVSPSPNGELIYNWGEGATEASKVRTAHAILFGVTQSPEHAERLCHSYAKEVVSKLATGVGWLLDVKQVEDWVQQRIIQ